MTIRLSAWLAAVLALALSSGAHAAFFISSDPTQNVSCDTGVCTATAKKATLNVNDLTSMLAADDVKVATGGGALTITVLSPFSWTSTHRLTLDALDNVSFKAPVTVAGQGAVTITYNDSGSDGDLIFFRGAKLDFWDLSSSLIINGNSFELKSDILSLASAVAANPSGSFALANDTDANGTKFGGIGTFLGQFDGLGHRISHLKVRAHRFQTRDNGGVPREFKDIRAGMFDYLNGLVRNLTLSSVRIIDNRDIPQGEYPGVLLGGLAASADKASIVDNVYVSGSIGSVDASQFARVGGLLGEGRGSVLRSQAYVDVGCRQDCVAGGLMGVSSGTIVLGSAFGTVRCQDHCAAGGLAGGGGGAIDQSYSTVAVSASGDQNSYAYAGGLAGGGFSGAVSNSYVFGGANGYVATGGLCGICNPSVNAFYSIGHLGAAEFRGGVVGYDEGGSQFAATYWDLDTTGISDPHQGAGNIPDDPGITGLTDAQLKARLPAGFDPNIWGHSPSINNGYPYLLANPPQ